nr:hypothetical protein [Tanacetum cinerariifolium]
MWGKFRLTEMFSNDNEVFCFKFKHEKEMNYVLENSPWMVNGRPHIVQKWSPDVCLEKPEPNKISLWVKMFDVPLEAWNKKGISKLASSLGKPLVMDEMTTNMCQYGRARIGFARVLVEVEARKQFKERIDVQYRDSNGNVKGRQESQNPRSQGKKNGDGSKSGPTSMQNANKFAALGECIDDGIGNSKGCRIALGWDSKVVNINVISYSWQVLFCVVESIKEKKKFLCSFVYAANHGRERTELWKDLASQNQFVKGRPWITLGHFNVTLHSHEHSAGSSTISQDMQDFKECVSLNELNDICSSGFQYTWTKSPNNPSQSTLKKLDRVMRNEEFITAYDQTHTVFLPYLISYHRPPMENREKRLRNHCEGNTHPQKKQPFLLDGVLGRPRRTYIPLLIDIDNTFRLLDRMKSNTQPLDENDDIFTVKLNEEEAIRMIHPVTNMEIKKSMFDINNDKAPGPDGFTSCFFKKAWNIVALRILKHELLKIVHFYVGTLPMKYLGVPLLAKCLGVNDYKILVEKAVWMNNNGKLVKFTIRDVWLDLRTQFLKVE